MENNNHSTTTNSNEVFMDSTDQIINALVTNFQDNPTTYTEYRKRIESLLKEHIKPLSSRSGRSPDGSDWKSETKARFSGRGAKWVFISLDQIESTLLAFESQGLDCSDYRKNTTELGKAWIRFNSPKLADGKQCAAFEVRLTGSTVDHPKELHYVPIDQLDSLLENMPGTPKALKLEEDSKPMPKSPKKPKAKKTTTTATPSAPSDLDDIAQDLNESLAEEPHLPETPESNDPEEWEAFLKAEGLTDPDFDNIDDDEDFDSAF